MDLSHPLIFRSGRFATWGKDLALKMPSIRDEFGRILDLRWSLARDQCASQPICALRVGPNRGKTSKSRPFKNEGIPEGSGTTIPAGPLLQHLARRNLLRGFLLSLPTGQAVADAMQMKPLKPAELRGEPGKPIYNAVVGGGFDTSTPLWYYVLREAEVQQGGDRLGSVGSRIVAETLIALVYRDKA